MNIDNYIAEFKPEIEDIIKRGQNNIAIGGSFALQLHGLEIGHDPEDLDIILFTPSEEQHEFVEDKFVTNADYKTAEEGEARSWKIERNGMTLNVILAFNMLPPENCLWYVFGIMYRVNPIADIIKAKLEYTEGQEKYTLRRKDIIHLQQLKNLNFNVTESEKIFKPGVGVEEKLEDLPF